MPLALCQRLVLAQSIHGRDFPRGLLRLGESLSPFGGGVVTANHHHVVATEPVVLDIDGWVVVTYPHIAIRVLCETHPRSE